MSTFLLLLVFASGSQYGVPSARAKVAPSPGTPVCPWLTSGSAARVLGGEVSVTVTVSSGDGGSCRFSRRDGSANGLEILVGKNVAGACPADSPKLAGIGNEATRCRIAAARGEAAEMLSSRVRDLHFSIVLREQKRSAKPADMRDDALEQTGEQVAGNLF
jgi:hypothetical protein